MTDTDVAIELCNAIASRRLTSMAQQGVPGNDAAKMIETYIDGLVYNVSFEDIGKLADIGVIWDDLKSNSPIFDFVIQLTSEFVLRMSGGHEAAIVQLNKKIATALTSCRPQGSTPTFISTPAYADNRMTHDQWNMVLNHNPWIMVLYLTTLGDRTITYPDTRKRGTFP